MKDENEQKVCIHLDNLIDVFPFGEMKNLEDIEKNAQVVADKLLEKIKAANPEGKEVHIFLKSIIGEITIEKSDDGDCLEIIQKKLTQVLNCANQAIEPPHE